MDGEYWARRFELLTDMELNKGDKYYTILKAQYRRSISKMQRDISYYYQKLADNNETDMVGARKLLSDDELEEFHWSVEEYIKRGRENAVDQRWMKELENASNKFHISRLEAMQTQMKAEIEQLYGRQTKDLQAVLEDIYKDDYYRTAFEVQKGLGVGYQMMKLDKKSVEKAVLKPWTTDDKTFSDRIWRNKEALLNDLHIGLTQAIAQGKNPSEVTDMISHRMGVSLSQAGRLVMTESAFIASSAEKDSFKELGVEEYEILATLDTKTSDICRAMDGKHFPMSQYQIGVTAPPFHPWCRSTTVPFFDDEFTVDEERAMRDPKTGKYATVPSNMKYEDWYKKYVDPDYKGVKLSDIPEVLSKSKEKGKEIESATDKKIVNRFGEEISFHPRNTEQQKQIIYDLSQQYETRLKTVGLGAEMSAGQVDMSSSVMRLSAKQPYVTFHEFAHTITNRSGSKYGLFETKDEEFWKEVKKLHNKYLRETENNPALWISTYEHGSRNVDEFFAEAFTQVKMRDMGYELPKKYGKDFTYSEQVMKLVDKYYGKSSSMTGSTTITMDVSMYPNVFGDVDHKQNTEMICDYINNYSGANQEVVSVYSNLRNGKELPLVKNVPIKIKYADDNGHVQYWYNGGKYTKLEIKYPKLQGIDDIGRLQTTLHEQMHFADLFSGSGIGVYCSEDVGTQFAGTLNQIKLSAKQAGGFDKVVKISPDVKKLFSDWYLDYEQHKIINQNIYDGTVASLRQKWSSGGISYNSYTRAVKKAQKVRNLMNDEYARTSFGGGVVQLQDIYDALSFGDFRDNQTYDIIYGHGSRYYKTPVKCIHEILANYGSLSITRPDLIDMLKQDYPEVCVYCDEIIREINKRMTK